MELKYSIKLPSTSGQIVSDYLKVLKENEGYPAWTLANDLSLLSCTGIIKNNDSYNYHNNYDDSENELFVISGHMHEKRWFSLNKEEVIKVQKENLLKWKTNLEGEIKRLDSMGD